MANLGDLVRDEITGYTGVVLARMECLYEATQLQVHKRDVDEPIVRWLEEDRCSVVAEHKVVGFRNIAGRGIEAARDVQAVAL